MSVPNDELVHIAFATDGRDVIALAAAMASTLRNLKSPAQVSVATTPDVAITLRRRIESVAEAATSETRVRWTNIATEEINRLPRVGHLPPFTFARLLLFDRLVECDRLIYLDTDLISRRDVGELWASDISGNVVGAAIDRTLLTLGAERAIPYCLQTEALDPTAPYFNAGVLLVDLLEWRRQEITRKTLAFVERYRGQLNFADQDALNAVLAGRWSRIEGDWNYVVRAHAAHSGRQDPMREERIYHFAGSHKPWNSGLRHSGRLAFFAELAASGWFSRTELLKWKLGWSMSAVSKGLRRRIGGTSA